MDAQTEAGKRFIPVSLIIATRDRPRLLSDTLDSIVADEAAPSEIVIVDQSDEPNPEIAHWGAGSGVEIRYLHSAPPGLSRARNEGIAAARYDLLVFTDDDMRAAPGWLATMVQALEKGGARAVVTGKVLPGETEKHGGFVPATVLDDVAAVYQGRLNKDVLASGNMAVHRSLLAEVGGFDHRIGPGTRFPAAEDNDLGFRLLEAGCSIFYVPDAVLYHRAWRGSAEYLPMRWRYGLGKGGFYRKHLRGARPHMVRRLVRDIGNRLLRLPFRMVKNPRRAAGDVAYACGVSAGMLRWRHDRPAQLQMPSAAHLTEPAPITVAVSTVGRHAELSRCLHAILTADTLPSEIVVVDQSGAGNVEALIARLDTHGVALQHLRQPRLGLSASRNAAMRAAGQQVIAITDEDCVPGRRWLNLIQKTLASPDSPDAVTGSVLPLGPETAGTWAVSTRAGTEARDYHGIAVPWHVGTGGNFAVKRDCLRELRGYDERLGAGSPGRAGEDVDLFFRLLRASACIRYEPAAVVYHERQDAVRRRASRSSYGHGIGAFCGMMARRADWAASWLLFRWMVLRGKIALKALLKRNWRGVGEERLVLQGTVAGLWYGLRLGLHTETVSAQRNQETRSAP